VGVRHLTKGPQDDELPALLESLESEVRRVLVRFRVPSQDAEDLLQDTLLVFLTKRPSITAPGAWILAALRHRCLVYWRSRRRRLLEAIDGSLLEEMAGPGPDDHGRSDLARDLSGALSHLPDRCRSVLRLRYGLECDSREIATRLGYQASTVRQVTLRCLSALSRQLLASDFVPAGACLR
jgi:RNA polymerase sigma factor (sigma-70 family)